MDKSIAELAAMRARGELTAVQFAEARKLLEHQNVSPSAPDPLISTGMPSSINDIFAQYPAQTREPPKKRGGFSGTVQGIFGVVLSGALLVYWLAPSSSSTPDPDAVWRAKAELNKEAEKKRKGFHCLSGWDGSFRPLIEAVKRDLRDPDSFVHVETRITPIDAQKHRTVIMEGRAANRLGGKNFLKATAVIDNASCSLISWQMVSDE